MSNVKFEADVELVYSQGSWGNSPWALWSDGKGTTGVSHTPSPRPALPKEIGALVGAAIRQKAWENGAWRELINIESIRSTTKIGERQEGRTGNGARTTVDKLAVVMVGGGERTLYRVREEEWSMGEDGDYSETIRVYVTEDEARRRLEPVR